MSSGSGRRERVTQPVMSSGAGRRTALACGVETSPEEYERWVLSSRASSAVGTVARTERALGSAPDSTALVQLRGSLHALATLAWSR
jgi:hypothetical protein